MEKPSQSSIRKRRIFLRYIGFSACAEQTNKVPQGLPGVRAGLILLVLDRGVVVQRGG